MSTERDELALILANEQRRRWNSSEIKNADLVSETALEEAEAILAAGYRRPRTITTTEELDALGHGSVIRSEHRHYWVAHKEDGMDGNQGWAAAGTGRIPADLKAWLPATVLHEGATNV